MAKEKRKNGNGLSELEEKETFVASPGWWDKWSNRMGLGSVKLIGEAKSADHEAAEKFPPRAVQPLPLATGPEPRGVRRPKRAQAAPDLSAQGAKSEHLWLSARGRRQATPAAASAAAVGR